jgi:hypothetical protein
VRVLVHHDQRGDLDRHPPCRPEVNFAAQRRRALLLLLGLC